MPLLEGVKRQNAAFAASTPFIASSSALMTAQPSRHIDTKARTLQSRQNLWADSFILSITPTVTLKDQIVDQKAWPKQLPSRRPHSARHERCGACSESRCHRALHLLLGSRQNAPARCQPYRAVQGVEAADPCDPGDCCGVNRHRGLIAPKPIRAKPIPVRNVCSGNQY